jgi:hypothetical protein
LFTIRIKFDHFVGDFNSNAGGFMTMPGGLSQSSPVGRESKGARPAQTLVPATIKCLNEAQYVDSKFMIDGKEVKQVK